MDLISIDFFLHRTIPDRGNRAELILTCLHRNNLGMDEFLGQVTLPLNEMDAYEPVRPRLFKLQSKPGKEKKDKDRGELEVRIAFTVKAGSLTDLSKKEKNKSSTLGLGGSLLSLGALEKRKSLKKFAKSLGSKVHISGKSKKVQDNDSISGSVSSIGTPGSGQFQQRRYVSGQGIGDADPGVISEDDDEFAFDNLSNKSSASSINLKGRSNQQHLPPAPSPLAINSNSSYASKNDDDQSDESGNNRSNTIPTKPPRNPLSAPEVDEWEAKLYGSRLEKSSDSLKRLSWDTRVPLNKDETYDNDDKSITAPVTPNLSDQHNNEQNEQRSIEFNGKPQPLPRSGTFENITEKQTSTPIIMDKEKKEKSDKRLSNKFKYFRKDKHETNDDNRTNKSHNGQSRQFGERIIIGHENDVLGGGHHKQYEVPQELLRKYEGKSREVY